MNRLSAYCRFEMLASLFALASFAAQAQAPTGPPPRQLPPPAAQTKAVPAGVDTGTPAGSDSVPLGTPVMNGPPTTRSTYRAEAAAARAAGRPKAAASASSNAVSASGPALSASEVAATRPARRPKP